MTHTVSSASPVSGSHTVKQYAGFGILGADIPTTGDNGGSPILNDGILSDSEYYWEVETAPGSGSLVIYQDMTFEHSGATDGAWPWVYRLYWVDADGTNGNATATVTDVFGTAAVVLAIADAVSQHAADNLTLDTSNATFLTVQDAAHAHSSDGTGLSLNTWLAIVEAAHSHTADAPVLSAATALVVAESLHAQFADVVVLSFPSSGSCPTASEIAAAVLAALNATTGTRTVGQHLQIQTAVLAGNETGAGTTHVTFTDGTAVVEADVPLPGAIGNRTNVTTSV